jgi:hypothetical protein
MKTTTVSILRWIISLDMGSNPGLKEVFLFTLKLIIMSLLVANVVMAILVITKVAPVQIFLWNLAAPIGWLFGVWGIISPERYTILH